MESLPLYYVHLFNAATDALYAIDNQNYGQAADILIQAQQRSEEIYLSGGGSVVDEEDENFP